MAANVADLIEQAEGLVQELKKSQTETDPDVFRNLQSDAQGLVDGFDDVIETVYEAEQAQYA